MFRLSKPLLRGPKFPDLTYLELNTDDGCSELDLDFAHSLSDVEMLSLVQCHHKVEGATVPWPMLPSLAVHPLRRELIQTFCDFVAARINSGNPLVEVVLGPLDHDEALRLFIEDEYLG